MVAERWHGRRKGGQARHKRGGECANVVAACRHVAPVCQRAEAANE